MSAAGDRLRRLADQAEGEAGRAAANAGAEALRDAMKHKLTMRSHAPRTPTPSAPGTPPAKISGALAGAVGTTPAAGGGGQWVAYAGPAGIVYARIQNKGGMAGRNHRTFIPPRPYTAQGPDRVEASHRAAAAFHRELGV